MSSPAFADAIEWCECEGPVVLVNVLTEFIDLWCCCHEGEGKSLGRGDVDGNLMFARLHRIAKNG